MSDSISNEGTGPWDEAEQLYAQWRRAMAEGNVGWALQTEHPRFRYTGTDGQRKGRDQHVQQITSGSNGQFRTKLLTVDRYGDTLVITGDHWARADVDASRARLPSSIIQKMKTGISYAFTSVWVSDDGRWRLVAHHNSEIAEAC